MKKSKLLYPFSVTLVFLIGALLRFWNLGHPRRMVFDESWYVPQAYVLRHWGVEINNGLLHSFNAINHGRFTTTQIDALREIDVAANTHGTLGKLLMVPGMVLFDDSNPVGWRIGPAIFGMLLILATLLLAREFVSKWPALAVAALVAIDGTTVTMSRLAMLDIFLVVFITFAAWAWVKELKAWRSLNTSEIPPTRKQRWWRPWWILSSAFTGAAIAVKISAVVYLPVFALGLLLSAIIRSASATPLKDRLKVGLAQTIRWSLLATISAMVYTATWASYLLKGYSWWAIMSVNYQNALFGSKLTKPHALQADAWTWPLMLKPTGFYLRADVIDKNHANVFAISSIGNPVFWWSACFALMMCIFLIIRKRDLKALAVVSLFAASWVPWVILHTRTVFHYYASLLAPFMALILIYAIVELAKKLTMSGYLKKLIVISWASVLLLVSVFLLPLNLGTQLSAKGWYDRTTWLKTWDPKVVQLRSWEQ